MDYVESLRYILSFTNFETARHIPYSERTWHLERIEALLTTLGRPHDRFPAVHIAGSKGKGSTAAMIDAVLQQAGLRTGLYTSPHLHTFRERVRVGGQLIPRSRWAAIVSRIREVVDDLPLRPNTFDVLTALGFQYFAEERVPLAVVEVGLGGRLDSTNVVHPVLTLITSLGLEHTAVLGPTLQHIAREKGGIIKPGVPVIVAPQPPQAMEVLETIAAEKEAPLVVLGQDWHLRVEHTDRDGLWISVQRCDGLTYANLFVPLRGRHQVINAGMAVVALHMLREAGWPIQENDILTGLRHVRWPGRMELLQERPALLLDGAHTIESAQEVINTLEEWYPECQVHLIFGVSQDKPVDALLEIFWPHVETVFVTRSEHPRAATPDFILEHMPDFPGPNVYPFARVEDALEVAMRLAEPEDVICVAGSIFLAAAVREIWGHRYGRLPADDWAYESDFPITRRLTAEPGPSGIRR